MKRKIKLTENMVANIIKNVLTEGQFEYDKQTGKYTNKVSKNPHKMASHIANLKNALQNKHDKIATKGYGPNFGDFEGFDYEAGEDYEYNHSLEKKEDEICHNSNVINSITSGLEVLLENNVRSIVANAFEENGYHYWRQIFQGHRYPSPQLKRLLDEAIDEASFNFGSYYAKAICEGK